MNRLRAMLRGIAPDPGTLRKDLLAGLPGAISSVPDGMAASVLAGVNPVHGLYASLFGPIGGGLTSSTRLMVITTTSAAALAAGSALSSVPEADRERSIVLLTLIAGALMIFSGIVKLGRYTRFVPHSVMIGFLSGVGANIVFAQLPDLLGARSVGGVAVARTWHLLLHPRSIDTGTSIAGLAALAILVGLSKTRLSPYSTLVALAIPSIVVAVAGTTSIVLVNEIGEIPRGLPSPVLPHLSDLSWSLVTGAVAVAVLVLVQGAGVSEAAPNPDQSRSDANQDFVAQGVGNVLSGVFGGQPVGGSVGQTALNKAAGARGRWAAIFSGAWMAVILVAFSGIVGQVVMSTLAAVLIFAAVGSFRLGAVRAILRTGRISQVAVCATFVATLLLPVAAAVGMGVALSLVMQLNREAQDLRVVSLIPNSDGGLIERSAPTALSSRTVVLLDIYGSLFYAGARTLQARLPDPAGAEFPAVVLRLRGRTELGATSFAVLSDYAQRLDEVGGRLYISGIDPVVASQMRRNRTVERAGEVRVFKVTDTLGEASLLAYRAAEAWIATLP